LQTNAYKVGNRLKSSLDGLVESTEIVAEVRGKGLMLGVELVKKGSLDPDPAAAAAVMEAARKEGLLIGKGGLYGNTLRIAPPLSLTEEEADEGFEKLARAVDSVEKS
jgi:4-aminobutyrate aminotransferase